MTDPNGQMFPSPHVDNKGLTKREAVAMACMEGLMANVGRLGVLQQGVAPAETANYLNMAAHAVAAADALIAALNQPSNPT